MWIPDALYIMISRLTAICINIERYTDLVAESRSSIRCKVVIQGTSAAVTTPVDVPGTLCPTPCD